MVTAVPLSPPERHRVLLAPVTVSPTKPLTPTHLKYLLSLDVIVRATAPVHDVTVLYHHANHAGSRQVAGFWEYLEQRAPGRPIAAAGLSEEEIGELYIAYQRAPRAAHADLAPFVARAEAGWTHPVTARLLNLWARHHRLLGMTHPLLGRGRVPLAEPDAVLDLLTRRELCIDGRPYGAPVYLDATDAGLPLRAVLDADRRPNYLLALLRELLPRLADHDLVVLAHDTGLRADYRTVAHLATRLGARTTRFEVARVPIDGVVQSTRFGGWQGHTLGEFSGHLVAEFGAPAFRLGLRLYLIAGLGRTPRESFSLPQLRRWTRRARRLIADHGALDDGTDLPGERAAARFLAGLAGPRGYAEPYRVVTALLARDSATPIAGLLRLLTRVPPDGCGPHPAAPPTRPADLERTTR